MDEDVIDAIAHALAIQTINPTITDDGYAGVLNAIHAVAGVINIYEPTYDMRYFYKNAQYPEPYPEHPMR